MRQNGGFSILRFTDLQLCELADLYCMASFCYYDLYVIIVLIYLLVSIFISHIRTPTLECANRSFYYYILILHTMFLYNIPDSVSISDPGV